MGRTSNISGFSGIRLSTIEQNMGTVPVYSGTFDISDTGANLPIGKPALMFQKAESCTGKGTRADEIEMDMLIITGTVINASTIRCYWNCAPKSGPVKGNFKFSYGVVN